VGLLATNSIYQVQFSSSNVADTALPMSSGLLLQSKAFLLNNYVYYYVCPMSSTYINGSDNVVTNTSQQGLYLMGFDLISFEMVCYKKVESGTYGFQEDAIRCLPEVCFVTEDGYQKFVFAYLRKSRVISSTDGITYLYGVQSVSSYQSTKAADRQVIAEALQFTGGQLYQYDGSTVVEAGFNLYPAISTSYAVDVIGGGIGTYGATQDPTVQYVATYEWTDQNGNIHRSAPSDPFPVKVYDTTEPTGSRPTFNFNGLFMELRDNPYRGRAFKYLSGLPVNLQPGDFVTATTAYPSGTYVEAIVDALSVGGGYGEGIVIVMSTVSTAATNVTYPFIRAATGVPAGVYPVDIINGSKLIEAASGGIFRLGQRIYPVAGAPAGFPSGAVITKDYGTGFYDIDQAATATTTVNTWTKDSRSNYITVRNTSLTNKENISLVLYRTKVNGSVFYRCIPTLAPYLNNTKEFQVTIKDSYSDAEIEANEQLYTTGGEVENIAPPAFSSIQFYKNRLMGIPKDNKNQIWYSKQAIDGYGLEFNDSFVLNVNAPGGEVSGAGVLDEKFIIFKKNQIYYMLGEGPNLMGLQNDFTPTQLINADTGCVENNSIINIPEGLMFKSEKGMYLLNRSLGVEYVGAAVEQFNEYNIISAKLMKSIQQVRFGLSNGMIMTYDYFHKQWGFYQGTGDSITQNDAEIVNGDYHILSSTGIMKKESTDYTDYRTVTGAQVATYIPISLDTGWLSFAGLESFQRIYKAILMGDYRSNHLLSIQVYYDFDESYFDTISIDDTRPVPSQNTYEYRLFMPRQKCTSIRFKIVESQFLTTIGEGLKLSSISFEVGVKKGLNKIKASESFG
jgi:hypothetical protein